MSERPQGCIFCRALTISNDSESLVVHRGGKVFTLMNRYPYVNGHLLVAPAEHQARMAESDAETLAELIIEVALAQEVLGAIYRPTGFNVGANFGKAAGAGIEDHYHFHIVPRWEGDVNFMSVTGGTRVIPELLETTRQKVEAGFETLRKAGRA
jgi:ATP adenylyltransferase